MTTSTPYVECESTTVVELTPPGRAAVAVVLVAGPSATQLVSRSFRASNGHDIADVPLERIVIGRWGGLSGEELVVCRRSNEHVEVHCHGGLAAVNLIIQSLVEQGCRRVPWQAWLCEISSDPIRTAAQIALAEAGTTRTAAILLDQYHGALTSAIQTTIGAVAFADWSRAATTIDAVLAFRDVGMHLTTPWRVVLAGRTNVGKSSLINALAGFQRSIVSHEPGTTRDVVTLNTAIDGWPVQFADTAGLRDTEDELESAGIDLAMTTVRGADLVIAVSDASESREFATLLGQQVSGPLPQRKCTRRVVHVVNKVDLLTPAERVHAIRAFMPSTFSTPHGEDAQSQTLFASAKTGEGIAELISAIGRALVPHVPGRGSAILFTTAQLATLDTARSAIGSRDQGTAIAALQSLLTTH